MRRHLAALGIVLLTTAVGVAQQPRVANGQLQVSPATGPLDREIRTLASRSTEPTWVGYAVPSATPDSRMCCWNNGVNVTCGLETGNTGTGAPPPATGPVRLDSGDMFFVLYRLEQGEVTRIRTFSEECALDAGGRSLQWLTGINPRESVAFLSTYATSSTRRTADAALSALAMHAEPTALDTLIKLARSTETAHVRGQALFWLSQRAGQKAVGTITEAIEKDPETDVKRRAVFALSQLPREEGVPLLINVARTHTNPAVRKQAIFWLGQSKDPRALKFFEEILLK
jgi:hypothetical protein